MRIFVVPAITAGVLILAYAVKGTGGLMFAVLVLVIAFAGPRPER